MICTQKIIDLIVPDIPEELDEAIQRDSYRSKKALSDNPELLGNDSISLEEKTQTEIKVSWRSMRV